MIQPSVAAASALLFTSALSFGASIPGLFNTGVNASGGLLAAGAVDPHYRLVQSADAGYPGPNAFVVNDAWPVQSGVWMLNGPSSKWIAPTNDQSAGNLPGDYVFRLTFDLTGLDEDTAVITGRWSSDNGGVDIRINGVGTGINYDGNFTAFSGSWTINSGFVEGTNTLDFVVNNAGTAVNPIGFRAELSGTADLPVPPGTPPSITQQPQAVTVFLGDPASLSVKASGSRPFFYQWRHNGQPIPNATNATYTIAAVAAADAGTYDVIVTNDAGAATSNPVILAAVFAPPGQPLREPLGPSNRRSGLVFSEIMYHPRDRGDGRNLEFIEIYNSNPWQENLSGWSLDGDVHWTFPSDTLIAGQGFLVVAPVPADIAAVYGLTGVLGGFTNNLPNAGGTVRLMKRSGGIVLDVTYSDQPPWPAAADGAGHSLVLARASYGDRNPFAWAASAFFGGSPGAVDPLPGMPQDFVAINELLAHTDPPLTDFVELYNYGPFSVDLGGCWLTDERNTNKFRIPDGLVLLPQGFIAFEEGELGFGLRASGETIYLVNSNETRVIDAVRFGGQAQGVSFGRYPDGAPAISALSARSAGTNNAPVLIPPVVINELLFNPISRDSDDEFLELFNRSAGTLDIGGWRLNDGINFTFPSNTLLAAGSYLVVAKNASRLLANYAGLTTANCLGDYGGSLANGGERLTLERPDAAVSTNALGQLTTNRFHVVVNEVTYFDKSRWSRFADGGGSSLELVDAHADARSPANWADSDETAKASWTPVEFTGTVDNAMPSVNADQVQLFLLGEGEALVDDVEVVYSGASRVPNPGFEGGTNGWFFQGTQVRSAWETGAGYNSTRSLHVRASDRGEPIVNRVRAPLTTTIPGGATNVTLRAKVRWLAGTPEFLMRLHGGGLELAARLSVPPNLGTPGARNSRARDNAGPTITDLTHRPILPPANQPIRVFARAQDPDGVGSVALKYRLDPAAALNTVPMRDDGTEGDLLAGDGVFTAVIPAQAKDTLIAFRVEAVDGAGLAASSQYPADAPIRECLIRVGDQFIAGPFGNYRIWMTQATLNHWATRGNLSNDPLDVTFAYGNSRIVYNAGSLYAGSPAWSPSYNSPIGAICAYDILFPGDDPVLNEDKLSLDVPIRDATNQREQLMHWIADQYNLPNLYRRDVHMFVNGVKRGTIYHDTQQPDGDFLDQWFHSDPDGALVKAAQWSEGDDAGGVQSIVLPLLGRFTSSGVLKVAFYRWPWRLRAADSQLDYTNFLDLVEAVNAPTNAYRSSVEGLVNIEDWMCMFAMNDLCSFWDAVGNPNKKNTYIYKPQNATWRTIPWDFDVGLGVFNDPVNDPLFPTSADPVIQRMYNFPAFVRAYWRELEFGVNTILPNPEVTTILGSKYDGYRTNGLSFTSPFVASGPYSLSVPGWMNARRAFLQTQLATVAANFAALSQTNFSTNRNIALVRGTAPISVHTLTVNGVAYPVNWTTVTAWTLQVPLVEGTNRLELAGLDRAGQVIPSSLRTLTVEYTGTADPAEDRVVISEIMYNPLVPESSYVELFNRSTNATFDLSGWRINGIGYTFPPGSLMAPRSYLVLAKNRGAFARAWGTGVPVFGEFDGQLDDGGETLTLLQPGAEPGIEVVVDRVTYDDDAPWSVTADGQGAALQLVDPDQDNSRVSNWASDVGRWRFVSMTGTLQTTSTNLAILLGSAGDIYIDDVSLVLGSQPEVGPNLIQTGDFEGLPEGPVPSPWFYAYVSQILTNYSTNGSIVITNYSTNQVITATNLTNSAISFDFARSGSASLHVVSKTVGSLNNSIRQAIPPPPSSATYTLSFWFLSSTNGSSITVRPLAGSLLTLTTNYRPLPASSPGTTNSVVSTLPPYPALWLSEVQPENLTGPTDGAGDHDPWVELYNAGPDPISLDGMSLATNYANLTQWAFQASGVINPGQYLVVWADGETGESTETEFHAGFRLSPTDGTVVLSRTLDDVPQILDYFNYRSVAPDRSYGAYPPAQASYRQSFYYPTPGSLNNPGAPPVTLFINEWMAANQSVLADPMDGNFDDWFEIYNPGTNVVDLTGFRLTDTAASPNKFTVPTNIFVPPQGFLLVWADEDSGQTRTNGDLHVNFRLSQGGEAIQLRDPVGRLVDAIAFGSQANNLSQGRYPDGTETLVVMSTATPRAANVHDGCAVGEIRVLSLVVDATTAALAWTAQPGCTYRVQFTEDLGEAGWQDLPGDITTGSPVAIKYDLTVSGSAQRFYRVVVVE